MCGIVFVRLLKPPQYYADKYGTPFYASQKLYLMMMKMPNRGQDGAGVVNVKLDPEPGKRYISRSRKNGKQPVTEVFEHIGERFKELAKTEPEKLKDAEYLKDNFAFAGEVWMGHLRYGTYGGNSIENCHPFMRQSNWMTRNVTLAGNFNLTNVDELYDLLLGLGQHPKERSDTVTVMEKIGHFLDLENEELYQRFKQSGHDNPTITNMIAENLDVQRILQRSAKDWDGGYAMAGIFGHGDSFVVRDPNGIRPAFYFADDEVVVIASEAAPIQTAFQLRPGDVKEIPPGNALIVKKDGQWSLREVTPPRKRLACSFERIYFSRATDGAIYRERYNLGRILARRVVEKVDTTKAIFGYIPNTAETCFYGLMEGIELEYDKKKAGMILDLSQEGKLTTQALTDLLAQRPRFGKPLIKDTKERTFITSDAQRESMVELVYDITHGIAAEHADTAVLIDDSIVRGTTLRTSVVRILARLRPKRIVIVSSAPQIRYPDCYGIDMARMGDFCAFRAAIALLRERGLTHVEEEVYRRCKAQEDLPKEQVTNHVRDIYAPFTPEEISAKISELLRPKDLDCDFDIIFQDLEGLHEACPSHLGDWYFSGHYPTPGGNKVANRAYIYWREGNPARAY